MYMYTILQFFAIYYKPGSSIFQSYWRYSRNNKGISTANPRTFKAEPVDLSMV